MAVMRIHNIVVLFIVHMVCHPFFLGCRVGGVSYGKNSNY